MSDLRPTMIGVNSTFIVLSLTAIGCRMGKKVALLRSFGWHDALILIATVCAIVFSILQIWITRFGVGLSNAEVPAQNTQLYLKLVMASMMFYFLCNWSVKHSLLFFYTDLAIDRWQHRSIYAMHALAFAFGCTCIVVTVFQCAPIQSMWDKEVPGTCINIDAFNYFNSCFMLATDLVLYAMPLIFTWNLRLRRPQRIAVSFLFALGGLVLAASAVRVYFVHKQAVTEQKSTYRFAATMICAVIENHLAIIVACAPSVKVAMLLVFPNLSSTFEKILSGDAQKYEGGYRSSAFASFDIDTSMSETKEQGRGRVLERPEVFRMLRNGSQKSKEGKWWQAPSNWNVNVA